MKFKGKELTTGSECYAAAMSLMQHEDVPACVRGAVELFVMGAEKGDRFCIARLKEIVQEPKYLDALDKFCSDELITALYTILKKEDADFEQRKKALSKKVGVFGVFKPKPVNRSAAMGFQKLRTR